MRFLFTLLAVSLAVGCGKKSADDGPPVAPPVVPTTPTGGDPPVPQPDATPDVVRQPLAFGQAFDAATTAAWKKQGFYPKWYEVNGYGKVKEEWFKDSVRQPLPGFKSEWRKNELASLPDPGVPFFFDSSMGASGAEGTVAADLAQLTKSPAAKNLVGIRLGLGGISAIGSLKALPALRYLHIGVDGGGLASANWASLNECPKLERVHLTLMTQAAGDDETFRLAALKSLRIPLAITLYVGKTETADIEKLTTLTALDVRQDAPFDLTRLAGMKSLRELSLACQVIGQPDAVKNLQALRSLRGDQPELLKIALGLPELRELYLDYLPTVSTEQLEQIGKLSKLTHLSLHSPQLPKERLSALKGLANLTMLSIGDNVTVADLAAIAVDRKAGTSLLNRLRWLRVSSNAQITDAEFDSLAKLTQLEILSLRNTEQTKLERLRAALPKCEVNGSRHDSTAHIEAIHPGPDPHDNR